MSFKSKAGGFLGSMKKADRGLAAALKNPPRSTGQLDTERFTRKVQVKRWAVQGFQGVTINGSYPGKLHVLMLPGGCYVLEAEKGHRRIAERFAVLNHMRVSLFQYPLSPEHTADQVRSVLKRAYEKLVREYPEDGFCLFGDSSGGSLALALLREIRQEGVLPLPKRTAAVSPWLDISLTNPKIRLVRRRDRFLPVEELTEAGIRYRGRLDGEDPFVSPLYGRMEGLGPILLFAGTEEILAPDCELFAERAEKAEGTSLIFREAAGMFHDWILTPLSETDVTLDMIAEFFLEAEEAGKPKEIRELKGQQAARGMKEQAGTTGAGGKDGDIADKGAAGEKGDKAVSGDNGVKRAEETGEEGLKEAIGDNEAEEEAEGEDLKERETNKN